MTPEDVRKAVSEAAEEVLAPLDERIAALEATVAHAQAEEEPVPEEDLMSNEAPEALGAEAISMWCRLAQPQPSLPDRAPPGARVRRRRAQVRPGGAGRAHRA
jgi:hypothetical protein